MAFIFGCYDNFLYYCFNCVTFYCLTGPQPTTDDRIYIATTAA